LNLPEAAQAESPVGQALGKMEQRLVALERKASQTQASAKKEVRATAPITAAPGKIEVSSAKTSKSPHVAITLGAGEAISFLPCESGLTRLHSFRAFLGNFRKFFQRKTKLGKAGGTR